MEPLAQNELLEIAARLTPQWLAGFFDGEGCVSFNVNFSVKVNLTQVDQRLMAAIALACHGNGPYEKRAKKSRRPCYEVNWSGDKAADFLRLIQDHSIRKRKQIGLGLELVSLMVGSGRTLDPENLKRRIEICGELRSLNSGSYRSDIGNYRRKNVKASVVLGLSEED